MELNKTNIVLDKRIGKEHTQILVEGDIIVPDVKPDLELLLKTDAEAFIDNKDVVNERVNFKGKLAVGVLYLAKGDEKSVHSMSAESMISDFVSIEGVENDMWVEARCSISNIDYKVINERKLNYRAVLDVEIDVTAPLEFVCVTDIEDIPQSQQKKQKLVSQRIINCKNDMFVIKEEISIPSTKPNIQELLQVLVRLGDTDIKPGEDKIGVSGTMLVTSLYKGDEEGLVEIVESEVPFSGVLEVEEASEEMFADVRLYAKDKFCHVLADDDGENRGIELEVYIGADICVHCEQTNEILEDTYCINKNADMEIEEVSYPRLVIKNSSQCPVKEIVALDEEEPKMLQILKADGKPLIDTVTAFDDKVVVEGIVNVEVLYVTGNDAEDMPIYCYKGAVPFKQVVEAKGVKAEGDYDVRVNSSLEHIGFNMLSDREVEVRCVLGFDTVVTNKIDSGIIKNVIFEELSPAFLNSIASITIYVVKPGDTLWKIAKRFNTSIDELVYLNDIEDADLIYPGQRLLILKKIT